MVGRLVRLSLIRMLTLAATRRNATPAAPAPAPAPSCDAAEPPSSSSPSVSATAPPALEDHTLEDRGTEPRDLADPTASAPGRIPLTQDATNPFLLPSPPSQSPAGSSPGSPDTVVSMPRITPPPSYSAAVSANGSNCSVNMDDGDTEETDAENRRQREQQRERDQADYDRDQADYDRHQAEYERQDEEDQLRQRLRAQIEQSENEIRQRQEKHQRILDEERQEEERARRQRLEGELEERRERQANDLAEQERRANDLAEDERHLAEIQERTALVVEERAAKIRRLDEQLARSRRSLQYSSSSDRGSDRGRSPLNSSPLSSMDQFVQTPNPPAAAAESSQAAADADDIVEQALNRSQHLFETSDEECEQTGATGPRRSSRRKHKKTPYSP
jgi:hypothetical protein